MLVASAGCGSEGGRTCVCSPLGGAAFASGASSALAGSSARHTSGWLRAVLGDAARYRRCARAGLTGRATAAVRDVATGALQQDRAAQAVVVLIVNIFFDERWSG